MSPGTCELAALTRLTCYWYYQWKMRHFVSTAWQPGMPPSEICLHGGKSVALLLLAALQAIRRAHYHTADIFSITHGWHHQTQIRPFRFLPKHRSAVYSLSAWHERTNRLQCLHARSRMGVHVHGPCGSRCKRGPISHVSRTSAPLRALRSKSLVYKPSICAFSLAPVGDTRDLQLKPCSLDPATTKLCLQTLQT
jgi:hypothetical protein